MFNKFSSILIVIAVAGVTSFGTFKILQQTNPETIGSLEDKITEFLENNPESIKQALEQALQNEARQAQTRQNEMIQETQDQLLQDPASPILGNKNGSIEMVLFIDPLCGFCRKFHPIVLKAIQKNKNLKVIVKDYPIIGGSTSVEIAQFALAAKKQNKYASFINQVYKKSSFTTKALLKMANKSNIKIDKLKADIKSKEVMDTIRRNVKLGRDLGIDGTPAFIINKQLHPGYRDLDGLLQIIEKSSSQNS